MSLTLAILGLLTALVPALYLLLRRKVEPTPQERSDEITAEFRELEAQIAELERRGEFDRADALRVQLITRAESERLAGIGDGDGQQLPPPVAGGNDDPDTRPGIH